MQINLFFDLIKLMKHKQLVTTSVYLILSFYMPLCPDNIKAHIT